MLARARHEDADDALAPDPVIAQDREGVPVPPLDEGRHGLVADPRHGVPNSRHARTSSAVSRSTMALNPPSGIASHFGLLATS